MRKLPLIQAVALDIVDWEPDAEFSVFPQGARAKGAVIAPSSSLSGVVPGKRYLFKKSKKSYPDQFWCEVVAYRVGCLMGVDVPTSFAAFNSASGESGALIEWFYDDSESFVHGGEFLEQVRPGFDRDKGSHHNLRVVEVLMKVLEKKDGPISLQTDWRLWWCLGLLFDALIGNTDRHQDNWGLIFRPKEGQMLCRLAPLFDNGTSLGHERFTDRVVSWSKDQLTAYVRKGTHHIKSSLHANPSIQQHQDLFVYACCEWAKLDLVGMERIKHAFDFSSEELTFAFSDLLDLSIPVPLTPERMQFMSRLLVLRFNQLKEVLNVEIEPRSRA
jgi:hypothetical protein